MLFNMRLALSVLCLSCITLATPVEKREAAPGIIEDILGKLIPNGITNLIKNILQGSLSAIDNGRSSKPLTCAIPLLNSDQCCVWWDVSEELTRQFVGSNGQCNDNARGAIRLGFHDAGSWDKNSAYGGADGSFLMDFGEQNRPVNNGLQNARTLLRSIRTKYGVGYADLAQYAHNHGTISCPKGPRVKTFVGRKDATRAAPDGLLPDVNDSPESLIALFANKGFTPRDLVALVGAHATARQRFVDTSAAAVNKPLDTTIGVWDVEFYNDTLNNAAGSTAQQKVFVLPSDKKLSQYPSVAAGWKSFVGNQPLWNEDYAKAYLRMSLLGVENLDKLVDCTKTLPPTRQS